MRSGMEKDMKRLDEEFREILVAIVGSRDGAGAKECVEWLKHGRVSILAVEFSPFSPTDK